MVTITITITTTPTIAITITITITIRYLAALLGADVAARVPPPHAYFADGGGASDTGGSARKEEAARAFVKAHAGGAGLGFARGFLELDEAGRPAAAADNPLLSLLQARWKESVAQLSGRGLVPASADDCVPAPGRPEAVILQSTIIHYYYDY